MGRLKKTDNIQKKRKEFREATEHLTREEIMEKALQAVADEDERTKAERADLASFSVTISELGPKEKAYAFIDYYYHKYAKYYGEDELVTLLISRGKDYRDYQSIQSSIWKKESIKSILEAGYSYHNLETNKTKTVRYIDSKDLLNQDVEKSSRFEIPDFWAGRPNEGNTIDATMLRVSQWCKIAGFEGYWKRLINDIELSAPYYTESRYEAIQRLYALCRSEYAIELMRDRLSVLLDILLIPQDQNIQHPWQYLYSGINSSDVGLKSSPFIAAGLVFAIIRLGKQEQCSTLIKGATEFLIKSQLPEGGWKPFSDHAEASAETTALCIHALALSNFENNHYVIENGAKWLYSKQDVWGMWFEDNHPYISSEFLTVLILDAIEIAEKNFNQITFDFFYKIEKKEVSKETFTINIGQMGDNYNVNQSQVGAVGNNASSHNNSFQQVNHTAPENFNFEALIPELEKLKKALKEKADTPEEFMSISKVAEAETAVKEKNYGKLVENLKAGGKWVFDTAKDIGVNVIAAVISKQMGIE